MAGRSLREISVEKLIIFNWKRLDAENGGTFLKNLKSKNRFRFKKIIKKYYLFLSENKDPTY